MDMAQTSSFFTDGQQHPLQSYVQRLNALKHQEATKDALIEELILGWNSSAEALTSENEILKKQVKNLQLDLEDAVASRRELQTKVATSTRQIERYVQDNDGLKNRNPYVMVLIDGDGLIFQDHWINLGIEGGKKAAYALRSGIAAVCDDEDVEVVAKVVANISGLGRAMQREGTIYDESALREFTLGFSQAKASFDFVDVGYGKERADSKIREMTRWNLRNHNCKQVFLGVSHDSGYAPFLDEILQDESTRRRVTLLEGVPTVRELKATGVNIHTALSETVFRADKVVARIANGNANGISKREPSPPASTSASLASGSPASQPVVPAPTSWVGVTKAASPPPKITTPLAHRLPTSIKAKEQPVEEWIPGPRGLDPPVYATINALDTIKSRDKHDKFCNNFFLRGTCARRYNGCQFIHDSKPNAEELAAIKLLARTNPCGSGQDCYVDDCIYGHHDGVCPHPFCRFPKDLHPPGTRFANKKIDYN